MMAITIRSHVTIKDSDKYRQVAIAMYDGNDYT